MGGVFSRLTARGGNVQGVRLSVWWIVLDQSLHVLNASCTFDLLNPSFDSRGSVKPLGAVVLLLHYKHRASLEIYRLERHWQPHPQPDTSSRIGPRGDGLVLGTRSCALSTNGRLPPTNGSMGLTTLMRTSSVWPGLRSTRGSLACDATSDYMTGSLSRNWRERKAVKT